MRYPVFLLFIIVILTNVQVPAQNSLDKLYTSINGTIINSETNSLAALSSEDGKFWCTYEIGAVTDEMRELKNLKVYRNEDLVLVMDQVPGSDVSITNSGRLVFYDHSEHFKGISKLLVYSDKGEFLFAKSFKDASSFVFSKSGELMGVRTPRGISVIQLRNGNSYIIDKGLQFSFSEDDWLTAAADFNRIQIYKNTSLIKTISTGIELPRKIIVSSENHLTALIDKYNLKVFSLDNEGLIFSDRLNGNLSFRDLKIIDGKIVSGIHKRNHKESAGILRVYDLNGNTLAEKSGERVELKQTDKFYIGKKTGRGYEPVPWPFFPFDSMRTVWNHYEQHMGLGGTDSYLHQGLDLITPIGEETYSVIDGYVKLVLTTGGSSYWRTAISDTQIAGRSDGWLSAHLIQSTIQFDVGDTVHVHDYLGNIIQWSGDWGHIHFVNISDSGLVWYYDDGEWGINFSPILALQPYPDVTPPSIDNVFGWSKFAFAVNNSATYLQPDSLFGNIDIIVKVVDYAGDSDWQQPAYSTFYTIKRISDGEIIKPRTMGHILNHKYPLYDVYWYVDYAGVMFQRDNTLLPPDWMSTQRNYYHNLTNSNGDSLVELSEKSLAFNTDNYPDGDYRIIVEVYDESGNSDKDSMVVKFKNGNPVPVELISFNAEAINQDVDINWSTTSELNNHGFEIQRGNSKDNFTTIGFVEGNGTSTEQHDYAYRDKNVKSGKYYYRLKQLDFNGSYKYSNSIEITVAPAEFSLDQNYPNPFNPVTSISYAIPEKQFVSIKVYNVLGKEVADLVNEYKSAGKYSIKFDASNLPSGVYYYRISSGNFIQTRKMILLK